MKKIFILFLAVMLLLSMPMQAFAHIHTHLGEHEEETSEDCPAEQGMGGFGAFLLTFVSGMVTVIGAASVLLFKRAASVSLPFSSVFRAVRHRMRSFLRTQYAFFSPHS